MSTRQQRTRRPTPTLRGRSLPVDREAELICADLQSVLKGAQDAARDSVAASSLTELYHYLEYSLGWRDQTLRLAPPRTGKLVRPRLLLLTCDFVAGRDGADSLARQRLARRALPAASSIELLHNFTLIHDDIEDYDALRRGRPTLWRLLGIPQAINAGDVLCSLARVSLSRLAERHVPAATVLQLSTLFDLTYLELCEGQYLDLAAEGVTTTTPDVYLATIERKTAALMGCATAMGAELAEPADRAVVARLARFGRALGSAFQLRDDVLGIWGTDQLGKPALGDLRRKKMTFPVLYALASAQGADRDVLLDLYASAEEPSADHLRAALHVLERGEARAACLAQLALARTRAETALADVAVAKPQARAPLARLRALLASSTAL